MRDQVDNQMDRAAAATHRVATAADLEGVRRRMAGFANADGLPGERVDRLVVALSEVATNALVHGGGIATVTMTQDNGRIVVTVSDTGTHSADEEFPPAAAARPDPTQLGGRGLWITRQLCDEVTIDSAAAGTTVKLIMRLPGPGG